MQEDSAWPGGRTRVIAVAGPLALAVFQVVGTLGAARGQHERQDLDPLAFALVVAGPLALLRVRQNPVPVLWFVCAVTLTYLLRGYPYGPVFLSLAIAVLCAVALGHRLAAWLAMGALLVAHWTLRGVFLDEPWSWGQFLGVSAWLLVLLSAGEVIRVRRERAQSARRIRVETRRRQANEERLRIARELHDVVAHHMSLINVQAGVALHLVDRRPEQAQTALMAIKDASKEALVELRALVGVLRDETEAAPRFPASMLDSLDDLVERSAHAGLEAAARRRRGAAQGPRAASSSTSRPTGWTRPACATCAALVRDLGRRRPHRAAVQPPARRGAADLRPGRP